MATILASPHPVNNPPGLRLIQDEEAPPYDGQAPRSREPFVMISHVVFREYAAKAGPTAWSVYTCLVFHADREGRCFPSHATIGKEVGIGSRTTVITALKRLVELGMIRVASRQLDGGIVTSNVYEIRAGMPVQNPDSGCSLMEHPCSNSEHPSPQKLNTPCSNSEHKLEPLNYTHLTTTENTPLPPKGEDEQPAKTQASRKERSVSWPDDFVLTDQLRATASRARIRPDRVETIFQRFKDHAHAKGVRNVSWPHAWATWVNSPYQDHDREGPAVGTKPEAREEPARARKRMAALQKDVEFLERTGAPAWKVDNVRREMESARAAAEVAS